MELKKSLTEQFRDIKEAKERLSIDEAYNFNPLGDFIRSLSEKNRDEFLDIMFPTRKLDEIKGNIRRCWRTYRTTRKYYFMGPKTDMQQWAMLKYSKSIKKSIGKCRKLSQGSK